MAEHQLRSQASRGGGYMMVNSEEEGLPPRRGVGPVGGDRGRENLSAEDEDTWDRLG